MTEESTTLGYQLNSVLKHVTTGVKASYTIRTLAEILGALATDDACEPHELPERFRNNRVRGCYLTAIELLSDQCYEGLANAELILDLTCGRGARWADLELPEPCEEVKS